MKIKRLISLLLCSAMLASFAACRKNEGAPDESGTKSPDAEANVGVQTNEKGEIIEPEAKEPEFINPLTGLAASKDVSKQRPVSIMINNINVALPQSGIAGADIIYECLAEGGITRLMMIATEYETLSMIGSVRSARDYYIDFAESYNCIFIHAGGSTYAYDTLANRGTDNIDGVRGPGSGLFYRNQDRLNAGYALEHTLFIPDGASIKSTIDSVGYSTEKAAGYENPVNLMPWGETVIHGTAAKHAKVVMSNYQTVDFVYNEEEGVYYRWQYNGQPHMDEAAGVQLSFENVILMFNDSGAISGDDKNRIWMQTTGTGTGYYFTEGTYREITWQKDAHDSTVKYFYTDGTEVQLNRGKTMINVVNNGYKDSVVIDEDTSLMN